MARKNKVDVEVAKIAMEFEKTKDRFIKILKGRLRDVYKDAFVMLIEHTPIWGGDLVDGWVLREPKLKDDVFIFQAENFVEYAKKINDKYKNIEGVSPTGGHGHPRGFIGKTLEFLEKNQAETVRIELNNFNRETVVIGLKK